MSFLESIIYGFISGFSEFSPVSSQAHQNIMKYLFGITGPVPLFDIFAHLGMLAALLFSCRALFAKLKQDQHLMQRRRSRRHNGRYPLGIYDIRIIRTATVPMIVMLICSQIFLKKKPSLVTLAVCLAINGVILIISDYVQQGNKKARYFSTLDSFGLGVVSGLSGIAGISRVGSGLSYSVCRGTGKPDGYNWALMISAPALVLLLGFDVIGLFSSGFGTLNFIQIVYSAVTFAFSFIGSCSAIAFMQYFIVGSGLSCFAFYSWGAALFSFIIYLLT